MAKGKRPNNDTVYQLNVTLSESVPPIWRRLQVLGSTRLPDLHLMLQSVMGWSNCHLHQFTIDDFEYSEPDPDFDEPGLMDEARVRLDKVIRRAGMSFSYMYDFGDSWHHDIIVEEICTPDPDMEYPVCLAGARACPPEDCGGIDGYSDFLEAIRDPKHEEHESTLEWVGGSFDPESFDLDATNGILPDYKQLDPENM